MGDSLRKKPDPENKKKERKRPEGKKQINHKY